MDTARRAILVTGASTGIGRHLAERLAGLGHRVYATARNAADLEALRTIDGVVPLALDVRDPGQIERARARIERDGTGLHGLVNNAGLGGIGPFVTWTEDELREIFDVNVFGPVRMSTAFLPLLLGSRGRIVNVGSQGGSISMRHFGPYTMTKHALEAFTVALDDELAPHGVRVSIVQPGGVVSAIGQKASAGMVTRLRRARPPFDAEARAILESIESIESIESSASVDPSDAIDPEEPESETNRKPSSPEIVTVAVLDALFSASPRPRYLVGTRWEGERVLRTLVERLLDANDCPTLRYPVEELTERLRRRAAERT